jgi:hypothetical protein
MVTVPAGGKCERMLATVNDVRVAYPQLEVAETRMTLWVAYLAARRLLLFSDRLTRPEEAAAVAEAERQLEAAGFSPAPATVPRPRPPRERPAPPEPGARTGRP